MNVNKKFYGEHLSHMETVKSKAVSLASLMSTFSGIKSAAHIVSRIKTPESMTKKFRTTTCRSIITQRLQLSLMQSVSGLSLNLSLMCMRFMKILNALSQLTIRQVAGLSM